MSSKLSKVLRDRKRIGELLFGVHHYPPQHATERAHLVSEFMWARSHFGERDINRLWRRLLEIFAKDPIGDDRATRLVRRVTVLLVTEKDAGCLVDHV